MGQDYRRSRAARRTAHLHQYDPSLVFFYLGWTADLNQYRISSQVFDVLRSIYACFPECHRCLMANATKVVAKQNTEGDTS